MDEVDFRAHMARLLYLYGLESRFLAENVFQYTNPEPMTDFMSCVFLCVCFGCTTGDKIFIPGGVTGDRSA